MLLIDNNILVDETRKEVKSKLKSWQEKVKVIDFRFSKVNTEYMKLEFSSSRCSK